MRALIGKLSTSTRAHAMFYYDMSDEQAGNIMLCTREHGLAGRQASWESQSYNRDFFGHGAPPALTMAFMKTGTSVEFYSRCE